MRPMCAKCGKEMTPENAKIHPEYFLHDGCLPQELQPNMKLGRYKHTKSGKDYTVIGVALHSETREELVIYRADYEGNQLWVRPKTMFLESIGGVPRFTYIGDP